MTTWSPITEAEIRGYINSSFDRMTTEQRKLWELIKTPPTKWQEATYGTEGGGFWVVAIIGSNVIWYNDIEEGFNQSSYSECGRIDEYWCNQDKLEIALQHVVNYLKDGYYSAGRMPPPKPLTL